MRVEKLSHLKGRTVFCKPGWTVLCERVRTELCKPIRTEPSPAGLAAALASKNNVA